MPLLVLILFGRDVAERRRDVYNDTYNVAQAWIDSRQNVFFFPVSLGQQIYFLIQSKDSKNLEVIH